MGRWGKDHPSDGLRGRPTAQDQSDGDTGDAGEQERTTPSMKDGNRKEDLPLWVISITWVPPGHESPDTP